ncbi:hypothetical protein BX666DRAFT_2026243 [Dichotomocladium elegans]|nr:hypothetical protein BX666DRAFT_2026243 [Dichotomocladium elegans]
MTDFLTSDIIFPSDSNEPKLSLYSTAKLPDPVDWAFHDYYSTALEKAHMPLHSLIDKPKLEPNSQHLRGILRGALEMVTTDMEQSRNLSTDIYHKAEESWKWEDDLLHYLWDSSQLEDIDDPNDSLEEDFALAYHKANGAFVLTTSPVFLPIQSPTGEHDNDSLPSYIKNVSSTAAESQKSIKWSGVITKVRTWMKPIKNIFFYSEKRPFQKFALRH